MQKTKTKTAVAVALVTFAVISTVAAATIIIRRNGGSSLVGGVRNIGTRTSQTATPPAISNPTPPNQAPAVTLAGKFRPEPQSAETWTTSQQWTDSFGGGNSGRVTASVNFSKALAVRHLVGENIDEIVTASFSSRVASIDQSTLRCEGDGVDGISVSSKVKGDNQIECTISGKANKEGSMRITFSGSTKPYTETIPAYTCTQADADRPTFVSTHPECSGAAGKVIPSREATKGAINFAAYNPLVFSRCADGQNFDKAKNSCVETLVPEKEPAGLIDLTYYGNAGCRPEDLTGSTSGKNVNFGCSQVITTNKNRGYISLRPGETKYFKYVLGEYGRDKNCSLSIQSNSQQGVSVEPILVVKKDVPPTAAEIATNQTAENLWYPVSNLVRQDFLLSGNKARPGTYYIAITNRPGMSSENLISQIRVVDKCE